MFDIFTSKTGLIDTLVINSGGGGYFVGEVITILGDSLGGNTPDDNVTFVVTAIGSPIPIPPVIPQLPPPIPAGIGGVMLVLLAVC